MDSRTLITVVTIIVSGTAVVLGTMLSTLMQGRAVVKALAGMVRQPEMTDNIRATLLISLAVLETASIYMLLVVLILLFANPLVSRFFP